MDGFIRLTPQNGSKQELRVQVANIAFYERSSSGGSVLFGMATMRSVNESPEEIDRLIEESRPRLIATAVPLRSSGTSATPLKPSRIADDEIDDAIAE